MLIVDHIFLLMLPWCRRLSIAHADKCLYIGVHKILIMMKLVLEYVALFLMFLLGIFTRAEFTCCHVILSCKMLGHLNGHPSKIARESQTGGSYHTIGPRSRFATLINCYFWDANKRGLWYIESRVQYHINNPNLEAIPLGLFYYCLSLLIIHHAHSFQNISTELRCGAQGNQS